MRHDLKFAFLFSLFLVLVSCESKFEEKKPVGISTNDDTQKEHSLKTQEIQGRLSKAQDLLDGLSALLQKIKSPEVASLGVSDLLVQIMDSVKYSQVERNSSSSSYTSDGEVFLTFPGLAKECRVLRTRSLTLKDQFEAAHSISIQSCMTGGVFKKILSLKFSNDGKISVLFDKDIDSALPKIDMQQVLSVQGCRMEQIENRISEITCESSDLILNEREQIKFKEISYLASRNPTFQTQAVLYKDGKPTFDLVLEIDAAGKTFSKATRIPEPDTVAE